MIAFKGFNENLTSVMGNGQKATCVFQPGETKRVEESKTVRSGFHCCENPMECLTYYSMNGKNRFFKVEAAGDIDEDESERIACTEITLLEELSDKAFAMEAMMYMIRHPHRDKWEQSHGNVTVQRDRAAADTYGIAIARGTDPRVRGVEGAILGLLVDEDGEISQCKLFCVSKEQAGRWFRLTNERKLEEVTDEETED